MHYQLIEDQNSLNDLCEQLSKSKVLAIDTEFVRTRTLYAKLGLLQVCDGEQLALIDPLAIEDLSPFWALLTNESITKVLHACSEDLEVFLTAGDCKPVNLIDSQIMMSFLGHGLSLGYAAMVKHFTEIELDKSESRTDWTKRPLTEKQLSYASADVDYLFKIYPKILAEITQAGFLTYAQIETQSMIEKKFTPINEGEMYLNIKMNWRLNPKQLNSLKYLASWRFQQAKKRDLPIGFVAKDHTLMALAQSNPKSVSAMLSLEGVEMLDIRHKGKAMLAVLAQAEKAEVSSYPQKINRLDEYPGYKQIFKKVKAFLITASEQNGLAIENVASKKQINQFLTWQFDLNGARNNSTKVELITDWRNELFGQALLDFAQQGFE
ncbi:ribonuclease D [Colwellia psychrerythraea]|uniref:Ribonuclease D n=1 Tax=Colwellia psychrerythraea TaxID=28229 RepID=A0A099KTE1_COLPS|nr:ribonuclease D [Colwellia psychrerythraea]KGJ92943.1 ribonuclease D [Colwellia psychrerythraea]